MILSCSLLLLINREGEDYSDLGRIVEDCKFLMTQYQSVSVCHILREANGVADRLAHLARLGGFIGEW